MTTMSFNINFFKSMANKLADPVIKDIKNNDVKYEYSVYLGSMSESKCKGLAKRLDEEISKSLRDYELHVMTSLRVICTAYLRPKTHD